MSMKRIGSWAVVLAAGGAMVVAGTDAAHRRATGSAEAEPEPPAYAEIEITGGGAISGVVRIPNPVFQPSDFKVTKDQQTCGERIPSEAILRAPDGTLKNAVVFLEGITKGKPINRSAGVRMDNQVCRFVPHVVAIAVGQRLELINSDPILHSPHAKMNGHTTVFDVALPVQNQKVPRTIREAGLMILKCDADHGWSTAYVYAFDHPYFAVTDEKGAFRIDRVPPGAYKLKAWHETFGTQAVDVMVTEGQETAVRLEALSR